ncbi:MAG: endonuclease/exonuclease/phosphatase family protein, partial [Candidatus Hydrogenedentales bacterium]
QPIIDRREAKTTVRVINGQTLVIGGLRQRSDIGDFNAVPPWAEDPDVPQSPETVRDATIQILLDAGLESAVPEGAYAEAPDRFHTFQSDEPRAAIDHIFYNRFIEPHAARVLQDAGSPSDHLPVYFEFRVKSI